MAYDNHQFCWHAIIAPDLEKAKSFYAETVGWKIVEGESGGEPIVMFAGADGEPRGHFMKPPMEGIPPHVSSYLRVEDVDAALATCLENGGTQRFPATDIPPGRFATVASPSGAVFHVFRESDDRAENPGGGPGSIHWVELHSTNIDTDLTWLISTFGLRTDTMEMPGGRTYYLLFDGEAQVGGAMSAVSPNTHSHWLVWVAVSDVDDCVDRIKKHDGVVHIEPNDFPGVGRMSLASDDQGIHFGVITPE